MFESHPILESRCDSVYKLWWQNISYLFIILNPHKICSKLLPVLLDRWEIQSYSLRLHKNQGSVCGTDKLRGDSLILQFIVVLLSCFKAVYSLLPCHMETAKPVLETPSCSGTEGQPHASVELPFLWGSVLEQCSGFCIQKFTLFFLC